MTKLNKDRVLQVGGQARKEGTSHGQVVSYGGHVGTFTPVVGVSVSHVLYLQSLVLLSLDTKMA
jgi:hypothetical protein